jgi:hypothetical protein
LPPRESERPLLKPGLFPKNSLTVLLQVLRSLTETTLGSAGAAGVEAGEDVGAVVMVEFDSWFCKLVADSSGAEPSVVWGSGISKHPDRKQLNTIARDFMGYLLWFSNVAAQFMVTGNDS